MPYVFNPFTGNLDAEPDISGLAPLASPAFTGVPTAPTPATADSSTTLATTQYVQAQGYLTSSGSIPTGEQDNATAKTSATTTFVNALTTTVTLTQTASIYAVANTTLTTTTAASVAGLRITINAVASRTALLTLTALTTNYMGTVQYLSASLAPGTYTVNFDFQRSSGTGTVNYASGTLVATGQQGTNSNGITKLTGDVTAGPGSGTQAATIAAASVTGSKIASLTITGANIAAATIPLTTKVSGILPVANGGTGVASFPNTNIIYSTGAAYSSTNLFAFDQANTRMTVGVAIGGASKIKARVSSGNDIGLEAFTTGTTAPAIQARHEGGFSLHCTQASNSATAGGVVNGLFSRGTQNARLQSLNGDSMMNITAQGYTGTADSSGFGGAIVFSQSEDCTATNNGGEISYVLLQTELIPPLKVCV